MVELGKTCVAEYNFTATVLKQLCIAPPLPVLQLRCSQSLGQLGRVRSPRNREAQKQILSVAAIVGQLSSAGLRFAFDQLGPVNQMILVTSRLVAHSVDHSFGTLYQGVHSLDSVNQRIVESAPQTA